MKKLIDDEVCKQTNTRRNVPSVVARLMGMDTLPSDIKPFAHAKEKNNENVKNSKQIKNNGNYFSRLSLKPTMLLKQDFAVPRKKKDPEQLKDRVNLTKTQHREHPQEEQLQKFKKEFEAWQASKAQEHSRRIEVDQYPRRWKDHQNLLHDNLNKESVVHYVDGKRNPEHGKFIEALDYVYPTTSRTSKEWPLGLQNHRYKSKEVMTLRNRTKSCDFEEFSRMKDDEKFSGSTVSTRIVILKPGPEKNGVPQESRVGSSEIVEEGGSIEDFLKEVKERLRFEMEGSVVKDATVRRDGIETPFGDRQTDPKGIARQIAKQVRESVTKDLGMNLLRSESTRSYRSEIQLNGPSSPEFINKDTRKLSKRLRNILRHEGDVDIPMVVSERLNKPALDRKGGQLRSMAYVPQTSKKTSYWENITDDPGSTKTRSFRHEQKNNCAFDAGELSPRNLIRSLSAPVSGTSFGTLLLEEPHILTGAHIRRKHESAENISVEVRKNRKDRFSFRGKVSSLRYSLTLRGRLFGKKIPAMEESGENDSDFVKAFITAPSVLLNMGIAKARFIENSTEVPPSPASLCSSPHGEFSRPEENYGHASALDAVPFVEDEPVPGVFREISSNLSGEQTSLPFEFPSVKLKKQLNQLQYGGYEEVPIEEDLTMVEIVGSEGQAETYIKDVLIAAGLYDMQSTLIDLIDSSIFKDVEAAYKRNGKDGGGAVKDKDDSKVHVYPPGNPYHDMAAEDIGRNPWSSMVQDEVDVIGGEIEWMITKELVEEVVRDMCRRP
ncbi:hypothetical protein ACLOJK_002427 [Asimina triloba]